MVKPPTKTDQFALGLSADAHRTYALLRRKWPGAFNKVVPLKIGIAEDILGSAVVGEAELCRFMHQYVHSIPYLQATAAPKAWCYDLYGQTAGPVSPADACYAAKEVRARLERCQEEARYAAFRAALLEGL